MEERAQRSALLSSGQNTLYPTLGLSRSVRFSPVSHFVSSILPEYVLYQPVAFASHLSPDSATTTTKVQKSKNARFLGSATWRERAQDRPWIWSSVRHPFWPKCAFYRALWRETNDIFDKWTLICLSQYLKRTLQARVGVKGPQPCVT